MQGEKTLTIEEHNDHILEGLSMCSPATRASIRQDVLGARAHAVHDLTQLGLSPEGSKLLVDHIALADCAIILLDRAEQEVKDLTK